MRRLKGLELRAEPPQGAPRGRMHIAGAWEHGTGAEWLGIVSPATGAELGWVPMGTRADAERAAASAAANAHRIASMPVWQRAALCMRVAERIRGPRGPALAVDDLCLEQGKAHLRRARAEVAAVAATAILPQCSVREADLKWLGLRPCELLRFAGSGRKRAFYRLLCKPKSVSGVIIPWNFPVLPACQIDLTISDPSGSGPRDKTPWSGMPRAHTLRMVLQSCRSASARGGCAGGHGANLGQPGEGPEGWATRWSPRPIVAGQSPSPARARGGTGAVDSGRTEPRAMIAASRSWGGNAAERAVASPTCAEFGSCGPHASHSRRQSPIRCRF